MRGRSSGRPPGNFDEPLYGGGRSDGIGLAARAALEYASARVAQKYGFGCGQALAQIRAIEQRARQYPDGGEIVVESFDP